jgi:hypothetical protein
MLCPTSNRRFVPVADLHQPLDKRRKVGFNTLLGWRCIAAPYAGMRFSSVVGFSRSNFRPVPDAASFSLKD